MIGFYGDIVFETSDKRILNFNNFKRNISSRWATHEVIGKKPASEFLGANLDTISFTIHLSGQYGIKPQEEMDRWLIKCRAGTVETLVIGNKALGMDKWKVLSVSQMWNTILNKGEVFSSDVDIELEEYVEVL
ncbi:phage protein U [Sedimentibacter acidaminivorans]|uniref:Phage protein U n=1 Tax=Sedimentibacter acidaminivorans TaxID=913099 RepID=A0ABS4GA80_9FIRM|nr:phage tail protein [Sedimentibacter acidaminivorans]MBP1924587.1 phage protein U [Sedimentibacter acidaminivorans]